LWLERQNSVNRKIKFAENIEENYGKKQTVENYNKKQ
jgi:hypothetical protein